MEMKLSLIVQGLAKPGKTKGGLAKVLGIPNSGVTALLKGDRLIKDHERSRIVEYLELDQIPIMGYVGTGAIIEPEFEQIPSEGLGIIKLAFEIPDEMIAFEVKGDSMLPKYNEGDAIVVYREQRRPVESFYGQDAVVRTADGVRYLKRIMPSRRAKLVDLHSFNSSKAIQGVRLKWIGEIFVTVPQPQVMRLARAKARSSARNAREARQ